MLRSTCCRAPTLAKSDTESIDEVYEGLIWSDEVLCAVGWLKLPCWSSGGCLSNTHISAIDTRTRV